VLIKDLHRYLEFSRVRLACGGPRTEAPLANDSRKSYYYTSIVVHRRGGKCFGESGVATIRKTRVSQREAIGEGA
jgi:hypothetical protein